MSEKSGRHLRIRKVARTDVEAHTGATLVEYVLLVSMVSLAVAAAISVFELRASARFSQLSSAI